MAMAAATLSALSGTPIEIDDAACVAKSFPGFWDELAKTGIWLRRN
jgi:3-phosphoshikimate 1-carboxyvinyltransferase